MVRRVCRQDSENMRNSEALANLKLALETFHAEQSAAADAQHALLQRELAAANVRKPTRPNPSGGLKPDRIGHLPAPCCCATARNGVGRRLGRCRRSIPTAAAAQQCARCSAR
jgi:hypothetical protein